MERRKKIMLISFASFILIIFILLVLMLLLGKTPSPTNQNTSNQPSTNLPPVQIPTTIEPAPTEPQEQNPEIIAADFAERYGSYSNQSNYENLRDLFLQMTPSMKTKIENYMAANPIEAGDYSGMTTKVLRTEVTDRTDTVLKIKIYTQRQEVTASNPSGRIFYQNANAELSKDGLRWLINSFDWLES